MYRIVRYSQPVFVNACSPAFRSPWAALDEQIEQLIGSAYAGARTIPLGLSDDKDNVFVTAELPGVKKEDLSLEIDDGVLRLKATRKQGENTVEFARSVVLPLPVQTDKASAALADGILTITLPKSEAAKPQKILLN